MRRFLASYLQSSVIPALGARTHSPAPPVPHHPSLCPDSGNTYCYDSGCRCEVMRYDTSSRLRGRFFNTGH